MANFGVRDIFARTNRGMLLDILMFAGNLFLMPWLAGLFTGLFRRASAGDERAKLALGLACLGMFILPAAGAVLKRWHFHRRLRTQGKGETSQRAGVWGCLFNPVLYLCLNLVIISVLIPVLGGRVLGEDALDKGNVFLPLLFAGLGLAILQTYLVYRYFSPPKAAPQSRLLLSPRSETIGDACIFLNMSLFQVAWNLITSAHLSRVSSFSEFAGRLLLVSFLALMVYFPPRIFYLAEDIERPRTWLTILLANSPVIARMVFGVGVT
jgi:hypothetical protein